MSVLDEIRKRQQNEAPSVLDQIRQRQSGGTSVLDEIKKRQQSSFSDTTTNTRPASKFVDWQDVPSVVESNRQTRIKNETLEEEEKVAEKGYKESQENLRQLLLKPNKTPEEVERIKTLRDETVDLQAKAKPAGFGFTSSMGLGTFEKASGVSKDVIEEVKSRPDYAVGKIAGELGKTAAQYGVVTKALAGTEIGKRLAGKLGSTFAAEQGLDLLTDVIVQTPKEVYDSIKNNDSISEFAKKTAINRAIDIAMNLAVGGALNGVKKLKNTPELRARADELPLEVRQQIGFETGLKETAEETFKGTSVLDEIRLRQSAAESGESLLKRSDVETKVATELPKQPKKQARDLVERFYQETVSKNVPFEKMGGRAKIDAANYNRIGGVVEHNVVGKQTNIQGEPVGKSVVEIFEDVKKEETQDLFDYVAHKHNIDRVQQGKPMFGDQVSAEDSRRFVRELENEYPQFKEKGQEIVNYYKNLLQRGVDSGLVSKELAQQLNEMYPNYVSGIRIKNLSKTMGDRNQVVGKVIKTAKGGSDDILPVDLQMIAQTDNIIRNASRNQILNDVADRFLAGDQAVGYYVKGVSGGEKEVVEDVLDIGKNLDDVVTKGDDYIVNFYKDGQPMKMKVNKTLYKAMEKASYGETPDKIARNFRKYATNPFKEAITGKNPLFAGSNIMRDIPTALAYSENPLKMIESAPEAVKQMFTNGEEYQLFKALGGTREGLIRSGKEFRVPRLGEGGEILKNVKKYNPIATMGNVNEFTETLPRFSEFLEVYKETGDAGLAIYKSAELTTDFARHGDLTKYLDSFIPYLNPAVQGMNKFFRSVKNNPLKTAFKAGGAITVPTIILDQINKDDPNYQNLPPRERNLYFNIPIPDSDKFLRIPKSRELGVAFSSIYDWAARMSRGEEVTGEEIRNAISENFSVANAPLWTPAMKAWKQIKDPDAYETNYWGGLIVPASQRRYSPGMQYDASSSGYAKAIGQQFNLSPYVVDYLVDSYTGIIGDVARPLTAEEVSRNPIEKKFINDPVYKNANVSKFYDMLDETSKKAQDVNKQFDIPSRIVTDFEKKANALRKRANEMSEIRDQLRATDDEEEKRRLQQRINDIAKRSLEFYGDIKIEIPSNLKGR